MTVTTPAYTYASNDWGTATGTSTVSTVPCEYTSTSSDIWTNNWEDIGTTTAVTYPSTTAMTYPSKYKRISYTDTETTQGIYDGLSIWSHSWTTPVVASNYWGYQYSQSPEDIKKNQEEMKKNDFKTLIKNNLVIQVKSRANPMAAVKDNERVAMETLREVVSEAEFRRFLKHGFILVKGKSGDVFQVFQNRSHTRVWRGGKVVEEICVRIKDSSIPLTDNLIAFKAMIEADEAEFKKLGNVYKMAA